MNRGGRPRLVRAAQHSFALRNVGSLCVPAAIQALERRNVASGVGRVCWFQSRRGRSNRPTSNFRYLALYVSRCLKASSQNASFAVAGSSPCSICPGSRHASPLLRYTV